MTKLATSTAKVTRKFAKKENLGKLLGDTIRQAVQQKTNSALRAGAASGSGAYGRGSYGLQAGPVNINSLFNEHSFRRHKTREINDETGRVRVSRREYVMRVVSPATTVEFSNTSFSINPGLSGVFAWLSQIAANYDEYELEHLVFHYKPVISQASTSGAMGSILLSCNYNAGSQKFESFREMAEYSGTLETRVCDEAMFGVECDPTKHGSQAIEYIRTGSVPPGQDIKTYDLGLFQIATSDVSTFSEGTLLGHLYIEYQVVLGKPKLFTALGKGILQDMWRGNTAVSTTAPFGTLSRANPANLLGAVLSKVDGTILLPDNFYGRLMVTYTAAASSGVVPASFLAVGSGNVALIPILGHLGTSAIESSNGSGATVQVTQALFDITASSGGVPNQIVVTMGGSTALAGYSLDLCQCNPDFDAWP